MARTDYYYDPAAPQANSLIPGASAVVTNAHNQVVLQRRTDSGLWALPGGTMDIGESIMQTAVREVREETGLQVEALRIIGVYSDPNHVFAYSDGEVRQEFSVCFACRVVGGRLQASDESHEVALFSLEETADLDMHPSIRLRLEDHAEGGERARWR